MQEFINRRALITGGSKGIGKAIAAALYAQGADIILASSNENNLKSAEDEIRQQYPGGGALQTYAADLRTLQGCEQLCKYVSESNSQGEQLSILVNSAGATRGGDFLHQADDVWQDGFALKFYACVRLSRLFWQQLASCKGCVINIVGGFARTPDPDFMIGGAVNAAMANFSKALAGRGIRDGVRVNAIYPGTTVSERFAQIVADKSQALGKSPEQVSTEIFNAEKTQRLGLPLDVANLAVFLASQKSEHIQGASIAVDGGATKGLF